MCESIEHSTRELNNTEFLNDLQLIVDFRFIYIYAIE